MRVLQLIDSLRPGGAERMAINLANALVGKVEKSFLCCTRKEGLLRDALNQEVKYLFLNKRGRVDVQAILKLKEFINHNQIILIHAHGTSFFMATIQKILNPVLKIIWHDHYGGRVNKRAFAFPVLYSCSFFFDGIIAVNPELKRWSRRNLRASNAIQISNFVEEKKRGDLSALRKKRKSSSIALACLANLRPPKNHLVLLNSFLLILKEIPDLKLYLIGKEYEDEYSRKCRGFVSSNHLESKVVMVNETSEIGEWLLKADIGILSSDTEGMPMAILEYAAAGLPVVCTDVGYCREVIGEHGRLVEPGNTTALAQNLLFYINNKDERLQDAEKLHSKIVGKYSANSLIKDFIRYYTSVFDKHR